MKRLYGIVLTGLFFAVNAWALDLDVAFDNLDVARGSEIEARENMRITDLAFKQGLTLSSDLLDAIYYLSRARFNVIDAHRQVFSSYFLLLRLIEGF